MPRKFEPAYTAGDIAGLYWARRNDGDEARLRNIATTMRQHIRLEHPVAIPEQYRKIAKQVRTPYLRDAHSRISASLVAKPPIVQVTPKNDAIRKYRDAAADASRFDMALMDRMNKESGEDAIYNCAAGTVRDGESVLKVVHRPDAWANFPRAEGREASDVLEEQGNFKRMSNLPIAWRTVDRLSMLFDDGEYGDTWALEYGEYPLPYLKRRYGVHEVDGDLIVPTDVLGGQPRPEEWPETNGNGYATKIEFFDQYEWHVLINGVEPRGWPKRNPYAPYLPYFRAKAYESESLLYSLLWLVPRLDELLTMKLNWAYLGSYPNPISKTVLNSQTLPGLADQPTGDAAQPEKPVIWQPGMMIDLPPGKELMFLVPPPIGSDTNQLLEIFRDLIEVAGIPSVMRGSASGDTSGYQANQMLAAASMQYRLASLTLQRQAELALDFIHWLISHKVRQTVYVQGFQEVNPKTHKGRGEAWLALSPNDSGPNTANLSLLGPAKFTFRPTLPTDEQARVMMAIQGTNAQKPLFGRRYALEHYVEAEDPDAVMDDLFVEQAMEEGPLHDKMIQRALEIAGLADAAQPQAPAVGADPMAALLGGAGAPGGQMLPPSPAGVMPIQAPGEMAGGQPGIPGMTEPVAPNQQGIPGNVGGRPPGMFPGAPPIA